MTASPHREPKAARCSREASSSARKATAAASSPTRSACPTSRAGVSRAMNTLSALPSGMLLLILGVVSAAAGTRDGAADPVHVRGVHLLLHACVASEASGSERAADVPRGLQRLHRLCPQRCPARSPVD